MRPTAKTRAATLLSLAALLVILPVACRPGRATGPQSMAPGANTPPATRTRGTAAGQEAPDFGLPGLQGNTVRLSDFRGQVVLLNFWATWCSPCRTEVPILVAAYERYRGRGFTVLGVDLGEPRERVQSFVNQYRITFPVVLDEDGRVGRVYPVRAIPVSLILDREGAVRKVWVGAMSEEAIEQVVEPLLGR